jgi:hypothetical protein
MDIICIIAILAAFLLGAYIRQPFSIIKRPDPPASPAEIKKPESKDEEEKQKQEEDRLKQLQNMLNYIGKGQ